MSTSSEFICKCKKQKGWITEGKETDPCPMCGRVYIGEYSSKTLTIEPKQIDRVCLNITKHEKAQAEIKMATKEQELIRRMFLEILPNYFIDNTLSPRYYEIGIRKQLGEDIGKYIQEKYPNWFHVTRKLIERNN